MESMSSLAQKCIQLKPVSSSLRLTGLMIGILEENTELFDLCLTFPILNFNELFEMVQVVIAECSRECGPWE